MAYGYWLTEERKRLGMSQDRFARLVGATAPKQSLYERGHRRMRGEYLARLALVGVDVHYILTGDRGAGFLEPDAAALLDA